MSCISIITNRRQTEMTYGGQHKELQTFFFWQVLAYDQNGDCSKLSLLWIHQSSFMSDQPLAFFSRRSVLLQFWNMARLLWFVDKKFHNFG